ncbi:hypothetical protein SLA2020_016800 [Shorea laevis]
MGSLSSDDFSVLVVASDLGFDARPFLTNQDREADEQENWQHRSQHISSSSAEDFSDLEFLQFFHLEGSNESGNRILRICRICRIFRIVGKYFPAPVVSGDRLKKYIIQKICTELPERPFCIVYMHSTVRKEDNSPWSYYPEVDL